MQHKNRPATYRLALTTMAAALAMGWQVSANAADSSTPSIQHYASSGSDNQNWILPAKTYDNQRYVKLDQVTASNVGELKPVWSFKISDNGPIESPAVIWHGTAYITSAHDHVYAVDVKTGALKWEFKDNPHVISFAANRGVALLDGKVYLATLDGHLIALDANTGKTVWDKVEVSDTANSFYTMDPMPYHNPTTGKTELLLGVSNGDWGGIGNISAFDPETGKRLWKFQTIPGPGQPGHDTWSGDSWKRGGAAVWAPMALDVKNGVLYANAGNPQPDFNGAVRKGSNLYSDSLLAIDIHGAKPKMLWYHQFIGNDTHDWDPVMPPILFNGKVGDKTMHLVADGDKAGNFWLLDADNGKVVNHLRVSMQYGQNTAPTLKGNVACPNTNGGVEFNGGAYDPGTNMLYLPTSNECGFWRSTRNVTYIAGQFYLGGAFPKFVGPNTGQLNAIDVGTGVFAWRDHDALPMAGGALATSTGLVFTGKLDGQFEAVDAKTGKSLWSYQTGAPIIAAPVAFEQDGQEMIAVASGPAGNQQLPDQPKAKETVLTMFALKR
jgi:alcohol dehydrogenase (cytochrome c)